MRTEMQSEPQTPISRLLARAEHSPNAIALIAGDERWSWCRLAAESERLAGAFRSRGIRRGDRIALHMFNLPELVVAYCACFHTGAIAVPLNARYKADELRAMIAQVQPVLYLGQAGLFEAIKATKANAKRKSHIP